MKHLYLLTALLIMSCTKTETIVIEPEPEIPCECLQSTYSRIVEGGQPPVINDTLLSEVVVVCQDEVEHKEIDRNSAGTESTWYKIECD